ncbi:MAG: hypothetical protein HYS40_06370 [Gemmatimonadetes bacterium]|nr:hypothetical protein [Gemmatimonadota bacterium]
MRTILRFGYDASGPQEPIRARELVVEAQRRLAQLFEGTIPGAPEPPAVRRGLLALVVELRRQAEAQGWREERDVAAELLLALESPSKLVGLGRKLRAGLAWLEQRVWDRLTAAMPSLLSEPEWDRRVA